jgi:hypothetical protein
MVLQLDPVQCKEYITFGDNSKGKLLSRGTIWVNENFVLKDVFLFQICTLICFRFRNSFRTTLRCALRPACLESLTLREILFVRLSLLAVPFELIFLTPLDLLDVWWPYPLSFGSGIGDLVI